MGYIPIDISTIIDDTRRGMAYKKKRHRRVDETPTIASMFAKKSRKIRTI